MVEVKIGQNEEGQRLNKYLMKYLDKAPSSFVYKMLRKKNIVLNGKKAKGDEILCCGDEVKLFLADDTIANFKSNGNGKSKNIDKFRDESSLQQIKGNRDGLGYDIKQNWQDLVVLYENKDIMAVHKKQGVLSQKAKTGDYSINEAIVDYIAHHKDKYGYSDTFRPSVCNRLDKNTSGIILAGISLRGSQYLSRALKDRSLDKYYFTVVKGDFKKKITSKAYISKDNEKNMSRVVDEKEYEAMKTKPGFDSKTYSFIMTEFIPVSTNGKSTLLKIKLITGKSHQIRAHLKYLGYSLAGDMKYGDKTYNDYLREKYKLRTHLLHAGIVCLDDGIIIKDKLPETFIKICKGEGLKIDGIL